MSTTQTPNEPPSEPPNEPCNEKMRPQEQTPDTPSHRSRLATLLIDCPTGTFEPTVDFWSRALGRELTPAKEPHPRYRRLATPREETVDVMLQRMPDHEGGLHLDIETDDVEAEVQRLLLLGAKFKRQIKDWTVLEDPAGHAFCVVPADSADWPRGAVSWPNLA